MKPRHKPDYKPGVIGLKTGLPFSGYRIPGKKKKQPLGISCAPLGSEPSHAIRRGAVRVSEGKRLYCNWQCPAPREKVISKIVVGEAPLLGLKV